MNNTTHHGNRTTRTRTAMPTASNRNSALFTNLLVTSNLAYKIDLYLVYVFKKLTHPLLFQFVYLSVHGHTRTHTYAFKRKTRVYNSLKLSDLTTFGPKNLWTFGHHFFCYTPTKTQPTAKAILGDGLCLRIDL